MTTSTPAAPATPSIPIATVEAPFSVLQLFPTLDEATYQALKTAGQAPTYLAANMTGGKRYKNWVDPQAASRSASDPANALTGILPLGGGFIAYPVINFTLNANGSQAYNADGSCAYTITHLVMTVAEAASYNCFEPGSLADGAATSNPIANPWPLPQRPPVAGTEELFTDNNMFLANAPNVHNMVIQAQQVAAVAQAASQVVPFTQDMANKITYLAYVAKMPGVQAPQ
jgi:hypothetical protein